MKLSVSAETFNELSTVLKRAGREINDGHPVTVEKGDAIFPPYDLRMVAIRQNCLIAAVEVYKKDGGNFLNTAQEIFDWALNGDKNGQSTPKD